MKIDYVYLKNIIEQVDTIIDTENQNQILIIGHDSELNTKLIRLKQSILPVSLKKQIKCYRCHSLMSREFMIIEALDIIIQGVRFQDIVKIINVTNPETKMRDEIQKLNITVGEVKWLFPFQALTLSPELQKRLLTCSYCGIRNDFSFIFCDFSNKKEGGEMNV